MSVKTYRVNRALVENETTSGGGVADCPIKDLVTRSSLQPPDRIRE